MKNWIIQESNYGPGRWGPLYPTSSDETVRMYLLLSQPEICKRNQSNTLKSPSLTNDLARISEVWIISEIIRSYCDQRPGEVVAEMISSFFR
jgi:hypothetical protein